MIWIERLVGAVIGDLIISIGIVGVIVVDISGVKVIRIGILNKSNFNSMVSLIGPLMLPYKYLMGLIELL